MDVKILIDAIVRQTTVLIAQLSTTAGVRAPLAHIADQVFLELAAEIETQGVSRKVAADMFGLALRSYQKKVQRLTESATVRDRTLWEAVLEFLSEQGSASRERLFQRFRHDAEADLAAVLNDLVGQGLVYSTGKGGAAVYGLSSEADRGSVLASDRKESVEAMVWLALYQRPTAASELASNLGLAPDTVNAAAAVLVAEGRVRDTDGVLSAETFLVPVGSERGWEAAVFDHFSAVANAIASKLRRGAPRSETDDVVGGATLTFKLGPGHPLEKEVLGLLRRTRREVNELWTRVAEHDEKHPTTDKETTKVTFYFGQNVEDNDADLSKEQA